MGLIPISDITDARLDVYRDLKKTNLTRYSGDFIVEGHMMVERLLQSPFPLISIVALEQHAESLRRQVGDDVPIYVVEKAATSELIGYRFHRGVMACGRRNAPSEFASLLPEILNRDRSTIVICPHILDATNLGSVIRNSCAMGVDLLILGLHSADAFSRRSIRVSMGAVFKLPVIRSKNLQWDLTHLRSLGFELVATVLDEQAELLPAFQRMARTAILFGAEGPGLEPEWIEFCDRRVTLPMYRETDSLNVATATGVFLYHLNYRHG